MRRDQLDAARRHPRVVELALEGMLVQHIAHELGLSNWAVGRHLKSLGLYTSWRNTEKMCGHCGRHFLPTITTQQYCRICVPHGQANSRMKAYGVNQSEVEALLKLQNYTCALCPKDVSTLLEGSAGVGSGNIDAAIDHDHVTGRVRGVLCKKCNLVMAYVDRIGWLNAAIEYRTRNLDGVIVGDLL
jgi:hypothetical protein